MPVNYLHGVETLIVNQGPRPVQVVKSAVIGLAGIAPEGPINIPTLVQSDSDAAQFGSDLPGFNIPKAIAAIFAQGYGTIIVVNTFVSASDTTQVTAESHTVTGGKLKLSAAPIGAVNVLDADGDAVAFVAGTDYSIDKYGNFQVLSSEIDDATVLKFTFKKLNGSAVDAAQINGAITDSVYTGMQCWKLSKNLFGFVPKILIAPGYSILSAVAVQMIALADIFRAIPLIDAPHGTTVSAAIAGRGVSGSINFNTSSKRAFLLYPFLKAYDEATDSNIDVPYSQYMAGVMAATDNSDGYWFSPSNREIKGIVGVERNISSGINDANTDANLLNEVGITTIFNTFGTGIRTWGNRNASFNTNTGADSFISVQRTADVIHESLENALLQFMDQPITKALIDAIRETGNSFIRALIARGALIPGSRVEFPADLNQPADIAAGHLTYNLIIMPPVPAERITMRSFIDINILKNLVA